MASMAPRRLHRDEYTVGWVCALPIELAAAQEMLDEEHEEPDWDANDSNLYTLGSIGQHNVVIACLPAGLIGNNSAAAVVVQMKSSFNAVRFALMVSIGGGVPSAEADIRLGDVVISQPFQTHGGVVQFDFGKTKPSGFERTGFLNTPPTILLQAVAKLRANQLRRRSKLCENISRLHHIPEFIRDNAGTDVLFEATYIHPGGQTCQSCSEDKVVQREPRESAQVVVHYGTIASGNQVMRDGTTRDRVSTDLGGVLCFEMEAAGLMNSFPCLVIRGICDYADSHKNKKWQAYAAGTAAACAKEVLSVIPAAEVVKTLTADETIKKASDAVNINDVTPCSTVPFDGDEDFVGRKDILEDMENRLLLSSVHRRLALVGPGGVGKTQIAVEYAVRVRKNAPKTWVFWIHASSVATLTQSYRDIAEAIKIPGREDPKADTPAMVASWLKGKKNSPWLLILPNNDDADLLFSLQEMVGPEQSSCKVLADYIPRTEGSAVIVTTRDERAGLRLCDGRPCIEVKRMTIVEAKELFQRKLQVEITDEAVLSSLLESLEYLPLAINQAIAFISENGSSVADYLRLLTMSETESIKLLSSDYHDRRRYSEREPCAADLLSRLCYLNRQGIPRLLLLWDQEDGVDFIEALAPLKSFRFLTADKSGQSFEMHQLVQLSTKAWLAVHGESERYMADALESVSVAFPFGNHENWALCQELLPHVEAVMNYVPKNQFASTHRNKLLDNVSSFYSTKGYYRLSLQPRQELFNTRVAELGNEHPSTLLAMGNLASTYSDLGEAKEAMKLELQVLELKKKTLGDEHPSTLLAMGNLASTYSDVGETKEAMKLKVQVLALRKKTLGDGHPDTLIAMGNLARTYSDLGETKEGMKLELKVLELSKKTLGDEHPSTLMAMGNLASTYSDVGETKEAMKLELQVLELKKKTLGDEHPSTLLAMGNLATTYSDLGEAEEALKLELQMLELRKKMSGEDGSVAVT